MGLREHVQSLEQLLNSDDPGFVNQAIELMQTLDDPQIYEALLSQTVLGKGGRIIGGAFTAPVWPGHDRAADTTRVEALCLCLTRAKHLPQTLAKAETLDLSGRIDKRPDLSALSALTKLRALQLANNRLSVLPKGLDLLPALTSLDLSGNNWGVALPGLEKLTRLRVLRLSTCDLRNLPSEVPELPALRTLELERNHLDSLPASIDKLSELENLNISQNAFQTLPPALSRLPKLKTLNISDNMLSTLPAALFAARGLVSLIANEIRIANLPEEIAQLQNLETLELSSLSLSKLPPQIGALRKLQTLRLAGCPLQALPFELERLTSLRNVDLSSVVFGDRNVGKIVDIAWSETLETLDLTENNFSAEGWHQLIFASRIPKKVRLDYLEKLDRRTLMNFCKRAAIDAPKRAQRDDLLALLRPRL